jgi:type III pantothenate kinase
MLLAIDVGNTNTVFAIFDGETQRGEWRSSTNQARTGDEHAVWFTHLLLRAGLDPADITAAIIATVVPDALVGLMSLCRDYFAVEPMVVGGEGVDLGIRALIDRPEEVGADRLVNAVAAHQRYGGGRYNGALVVVDFGTATTFDVVDTDGNYCGGVIAPGVNLSHEALHSAAAQLPRVAVKRPPQVIGTTTITAMQSGIFWGYVAMVEGLVERIQGEYGEAGKVIATGGLAPLFFDATEAIDHLDMDLTLCGLLEVYRRNCKL